MSRHFHLIETMRWQGEFALLERHLARLSSSAEFFGIALDRTAVVEALEREIGERGADEGPLRVRLTVDAFGSPDVSCRPLEPVPPEPRRVVLSRSRVDSDDVFRRHKTSRRQLYDAEYARAAAQGFFELLYLNERGRVAEGSRTNVFVEWGGDLLTPPVSEGALPGVLRSDLLETDRRAREATLQPEDLRKVDRLLVCNAVIGLVDVELIDFPDPASGDQDLE